ncbi:hypothetical protein PAHAL_7G118200 [Panicum hallii]|uniref:Uncharacterized protein n=1 Tax=Panicum hallii TaxID=206008 RepID=A0A2S3I5X6_9POAL|nr:uncharacterized protein LOC112899521 isoform X1 [Panicum hallii]PAN37741.1 hypothetical protein PAHAL_7G118200 [Panicum hallii]
MAEAAGALAPAQGPEEAPLEAAAIRSRVEQLSLKRRRRGGEEEEEAAVADAEVALESAYQLAREGMDVLDSSTAAISIEDSDAYLERLRKEVALAEEGNRKVSDEIGVTAETTANDMIQLDVDIGVLESLLSKLESEGFNHFDASPVLGQSDSTDSCRNQSIADKDCIYEVLELDHQIGRSKMNLKMLQNLQSVDEMWQLKSMLLPFGAKVLDFKDNCLRMFLKAPTWTSDCVIYGQQLNCAIDSFISDHELLIEVDEGNMEPKNLKIFPDDVCVDILIERLESSREVISSPALGWLIQQCQRRFIINALRRSLVNDANNSRHSFEYFDKEDAIIAHLDRGIDASIKISSDWPLCSYGLKLISICNSGTHPTNIASSLLTKTKELANGLDQHIRQHLVRFVDAVEEILIRELRSG